MSGANSSSSTTFGVLLHRYRERAGLSHTELAERAGVSWQAISALEREKRRYPYPTTVRRLADALGLAEDERAELLSTVPFRGQSIPPPDVDVPDSPRAATPREAPAWPTFPAPPTPLTPLLGREEDVVQATQLLQQGARLLTLTGPGGVGKTRLALQVATEMREQFADGMAFVSLAPLADAGLVLSTVAQVLGVREGGGQPVKEALRRALSDRRLLLVLDNCEHVLAGFSEVAALLEDCPKLALLATSRGSLRLWGEQEYPVSPLALPPFDRALTKEEAAQFPAVRLFVDRARAASPRFTLTAENASSVTAICRRLDGLPLAIELAAPRVKLLPPGALLERLHHTLPLLTGGGRDLPDRQQTLLSTIAWSSGLLDEKERMVFRRLAVFRGGCTLEAAEVICTSTDGEAVDVLEVMGSLVDKSLLQAQTGDEDQDEARFAMLETIREYAIEQLEASGEGARLARLHAEYFRSLAEEAEPYLRGADQVMWFNRLETELDNVRAALTWSRDQGEIELGLRIASAYCRFYQAHGRLTEGREWLEGLLQLQEPNGSSEAALVRAGALVQASRLARTQGDTARAAALAEEGLQLAWRLGQERIAAGALITLGHAALVRGDGRRAEGCYQEALALAQEAGDTWSIAEALHHLGNHALVQGEYGRAIDLHGRSLVLWRECGDGLYLGVTLIKLGDLASYFSGDPGKAARLYEESLSIHRGLEDKRGMAYALASLATLAQEHGDSERAQGLAEESLRLLNGLGERHITGWVTAVLAGAILKQGDTERALTLLRRSLVLAQSVGDRQIIPYMLDDLGRVARAQARPERAARLCGAAAALRDAVATTVTPQQQSEYNRFLAELRQTLGEDAFASAWARGQAMPLEEAIAHALRDTED